VVPSISRHLPCLRFDICCKINHGKIKIGVTKPIYHNYYWSDISSDCDAAKYKLMQKHKGNQMIVSNRL
jgi:hypothetical protein